MLTGRTADQKRKLAQRITDAMVEEAALAARPSSSQFWKYRRKAMLRAAC